MSWEGNAACLTRMSPRMPLRELSFGALACSTELFESLPTTAFYVKDDALRYVMANSVMARLCGATSSAEILRKATRDVFPEAVRARHETLDRHVMRTCMPLRDQLELCVSASGAKSWLLTTRWPVCAEIGTVAGVAGLARLLDVERRNHTGYEKLAAAVEHLRTHYWAPCDISELARRTGLSSFQLKREFIAVLGMPPRRYLTKLRLEAALEKLASDLPIVAIAHSCGYPDQSAFTRRFRALLGMSPSDYRRNYVNGERARTLAVSL
ncbi:MAG: helix-turn-helix domain-containing protein [Hyphomonadaceae bacterium]|nr:helix-turn-helix domain-containing protein [Hyphomonadaceae bacterium]